MRGSDKRSGSLFSYVDLEARVRRDHPLRAIRHFADGALEALTVGFGELYSSTGRPSIPPEMLLRAMLLQAFYTIRSERQLMERMEFDLLFRWFVGLSIDDPIWDHSVFSKNRDRLLEGDAAAKFLNAVLAQPGVKRLLSSEHFSVDGTLIEAWASMKSFRPKGEGDTDDPASGGGRNLEVDFKGEKRSNETHESTTDPEARLYRKGAGMEAKLCFIGHALMENRSGLIVDTRLTAADGHAERIAALAMIEARADRPRAVTLGTDKGYDAEDFVNELKSMHVRPHIAEHQRATLGDRPTHDASRRLRSKPAHPQAHRGGVRLDQDRGWTAQDQVPRPRSGRVGLRLCRGGVQPGAAAQAHGWSGVVRRPRAMAKAFKGRWRISEMDVWDNDYLDLVEPAHIVFESENDGAFVFGTVKGWLDVRYGARDGSACAEFSWEGLNDTDPACGRGWVILGTAGRLVGHIFIHNSDDSGFVAERE